MKSSPYIKKARQIAGLSQKEVAELCGVTQPYISDLERGRFDPSLGFFLEMCRKIGIKDFNEILKL